MAIIVFTVVVVCAGAVMAALSLYTDRKAQQAQRYNDAADDLRKSRDKLNENVLYNSADQEKISQAYQNWYVEVDARRPAKKKTKKAAAATRGDIKSETIYLKGLGGEITLAVEKPRAKKQAKSKSKAIRKANKTAKLRGDRG